MTQPQSNPAAESWKRAGNPELDHITCSACKTLDFLPPEKVLKARQLHSAGHCAKYTHSESTEIGKLWYRQEHDRLTFAKECAKLLTNLLELNRNIIPCNTCGATFYYADADIAEANLYHSHRD